MFTRRRAREASTDCQKERQQSGTRRSAPVVAREFAHNRGTTPSRPRYVRNAGFRALPGSCSMLVCLFPLCPLLCPVTKETCLPTRHGSFGPSLQTPTESLPVPPAISYIASPPPVCPLRCGACKRATQLTQTEEGSSGCGSRRCRSTSPLKQKLGVLEKNYLLPRYLQRSSSHPYS